MAVRPDPILTISWFWRVLAAAAWLAAASLSAVRLRSFIILLCAFHSPPAQVLFLHVLLRPEGGLLLVRIAERCRRACSFLTALLLRRSVWLLVS